MSKAILFTIICCLISVDVLYAGPVLKEIRQFAVRATALEVDEVGNIYLLTENNTVIRYNIAGDSTGYFPSVHNGPVGNIDVINPLKWLIFYPQFAKIILMDQMMLPKAEYDIKMLAMRAAPVAALSMDGGFWIYDGFETKLMKIDQQLRLAASSNDLRQELQFTPEVNQILERENKVYMVDPKMGIIQFDRYGNFQQLIEIAGISHLQVIQDDLIYQTGNQLHFWNKRYIASNTIEIPEELPGSLLQVCWYMQTIIALYTDRCIIYRLAD